MKARYLGPTAAAVTAAVLLAACSSSGSSSSPAASSPASASSPAAGAGSSSSASAPASQAPGAYTMSTANCTNPDQAAKKITGTLTLGWSGPFSGPIAPFADAVVQGAKDRFAVANAAGGVGGVTLAVATKDDQFNPAQPSPTWTAGSSRARCRPSPSCSGPLAVVAADQNLACLPNLFVNATNDTYRDIAKYPWTTEFLPSNTVEEAAEVKVIQAAFPSASKITVAVAEDMTGSGASYLAACRPRPRAPTWRSRRWSRSAPTPAPPPSACSRPGPTWCSARSWCPSACS